jgi:Glycosyl hydrolases family 16
MCSKTDSSSLRARLLSLFALSLNLGGSSATLFSSSWFSAGALPGSATNVPAVVSQFANLTEEALLNATGNKCHYLQTAPLVENFANATLNTTRWDSSSIHGLFHCPRGSTRQGAGKLGEDQFCTMALRDNLAMGAALPFFPGTKRSGEPVLGAVLTMSQSPCNSADPTLAAQCCRGRDNKCANYSGAHLVSKFCILYGTLSATMSIKIPGANSMSPGSAAMFDVGTYVDGGIPDPAWNELDEIFQLGPNGTVEYHTTFFNPDEHKRVFGLYSRPQYDGHTASSWRTYNVTWTPDYIAWSVDDKVYRNTSSENPEANRPPWRPQSVRLIFRTNNASVPDVPVPDAHVFIHQLVWTPLESWQYGGKPRSAFGNTFQLLAPAAGAGFVLRSLTWMGLWLAGAFYLRDALSFESEDNAAGRVPRRGSDVQTDDDARL